MAQPTTNVVGTVYKRSNLKVIGYCMVVGMLAVTQGLDIGETAGFLAMPRFNQDFGSYSAATQTWSTTAGQQTEMYGLLLGGAIVSSAASGWIGARWGRRFGIFLGAFTGLINPIIQATVTTWPGLMAGKFISGLGIGFGQTFVIPYWSETTPATLRGLMLVALQGIINVFTFVGQCINEGTHNLTTRWAYRGPLLTELLAPLILIALIYWIPETPRYLVSRGRDDDALDAMRRLRGPTYPEEEIREEVNEVITMDRIEKELEGASRWRDCFQGTDLRRTVISVIAIVCQEFSGIAFITGYGTYFFSISGVTNPFVISVITGICGIVGSAAAFPLIKYFGRRPILITGAAAQGISMLTFAIVAVAAPGSKAAAQCLAAFVSLFIFSYGATWGAVGPVVLGELSSTKVRSKTLSLCYIAGWSADLLIICGTPYLISADYANLGAKVGFIFGGISILVFIWSFFYLPETKDRTLEEIDEMFMNKVPARKFKSYVITKNIQGISVQAEMDILAQKLAYQTRFSASSVTNWEFTQNPYKLGYDVGGSSSGSAAAVAANFAIRAVAEDTGGSIRCPASFTNLVGIRVTPGIISRNGFCPLVKTQDTPGPVARTVVDCALMLDCLVGFDRDDEWTAIARTAPIKRGGSYAAGLDASASAVAKFKIGIVGALFGPESDPSCRAVNVVIKNAISKLSATGTEFIDVEIPDLTHYMTTTPAYVVRSRSDINEFLSTKPHLPQDIALILPREPPHPSMDLTSAVAHGPKDPMSDPTFLKRLLDRDEFQRRVTCLMADYNLDALTFSDVQIPPPRHVESTNGRFPTCWDLPVNTLLASQARLPSITVPVGFTEDGLPVGMEFVSWEYREQDLLELAKGVENCIPARKAPRLELLNSR